MNDIQDMRDKGRLAQRALAWARDMRYAIAASAATMAATWATPALAADATQILNSVKNLLAGGVGMLGAGMVVFGAVGIGTNIHNGAQGNGAAIAGGVATLVGGVIIAAAAVFFGTLDTGWVNVQS